MKIKIIIASVFIAFFAIGGFLYLSKNNIVAQTPTKKYIVVRFQGSVEYTEYITIQSGTKLSKLLEIVNAKDLHNNPIYIKNGSKWDLVDMEYVVKYDSVFKIGK